ncbi:MAG: class I SAM-dependent methyltransferase [Acidobacteriia bacterium]|nr:class I SAM-dependent methyltransferase [Terriglobia bacterium]
MHLFDAGAAQFDRHRAFPEGVPEAIRRAVWAASPPQAGARVLDLGAGTGRIGRAFVTSRDEYFGVDLSLGMLREFQVSAGQEGKCRLVQADGCQLPFLDHSFGIVMLMQVLSGANDWQPILSEACRVVRPGGVIIAGHTAMPPEGIDKQLKRRLSEILAESGNAPHGGSRRRNDALEWLDLRALHHVHRIAASWNASRTPRQFLERHRTGAKFSALPAGIQAPAMEQLSAWAENSFGSLDTIFPEQHAFELEIFEF